MCLILLISLFQQYPFSPPFRHVLRLICYHPIADLLVSCTTLRILFCFRDPLCLSHLTNTHFARRSFSYIMAVRPTLTGYGPRMRKTTDAFYATSAITSRSRFQQICFDGNPSNYGLWETKFLAYLYTVDEKLHTAILASAKPVATDNKRAFAELVQILDDKSLQLVKNDAIDDANSALKILRKQYRSS